MPSLYSRVFLQILDSSIAEDWQVRHVFEDFLKLADRSGIVDMTRAAIARRINMPLEIVDTCITKLESPDPNSRDPNKEGRRIERLSEHRDWGWKIVNWEAYESIRDRAAANERLQRHREKKKNATNGDHAPIPETTKKHMAARPLLHYLNEKTGAGYRETETNLGFIGERLAEDGVDAAGVRVMIDRQVAKWKGTKMAEYLRPETLFNKTKFDGYYANRLMPIETEDKPAPPRKSKALP